MANLVTTPEAYAQPKHRANGGKPEAAANYALHPKAQEAVAVFSDAMLELDNARETIRAMQNKIDVQEASIRELQYAVDIERVQKERFQRYCVTFQTLIGSITHAAQQANDAASEYALQQQPPKQVEPPPPPKPSMSKVESEVESAIAELRASTQ